MGRVSFIEKHEKKVMIIDLSNITENEQVSEAIEEVRIEYLKEGPFSVLSLVNVTNSVFNTQIVSRIKMICSELASYTIKSAWLGIDGLKAVIFKGSTRHSETPIQSFETAPDAIDWLLSDK